MSTEVHEHEHAEARARADRDAARARRDTVKSTDPVYDDIEARARANQEAAATAKAQTEVYTAIATERGIQCQKAHELVDLWFADWDAEKAKRWVALTASDGDVPDLTPNVDHVLALIGLCLGFAPVHTIEKPAVLVEPVNVTEPGINEPAYGVAPPVHADQPTQY